ncbi:efflux RND transporter periplasmic adaptor subunit [Arsukibacterium indicum]|uniref:Efflux RND transporter periplasmic adaptor subunit n=1 Tax=Arsukibacterium indicum TaxID=2848612 RepID=A0ABS6MJG2_9GAMM|nr:efflux RND transporter periplasmic adaptor subunit [Arsukibacterium indicum]MBV2128958.1 efflux RND transporter periplasmic adaptor subunit [Arsukibacterium indicum]
MLKILSLSSILFSALTFAQTAPATSVQLTESRLSYEVPTIDAAGTVYSQNNTELTAGIDGRLSWVAEAGTLVAAGDLLAQLDPRPLQLQQAELRAQLQRANLQAAYFQREYQRLQELQQSQSIAGLQLDKAEADYQLAQADAGIINARIAQLADQLSRTEVRAPFAGVVAERLREAGGDVSRSTPLLRLQDIYQLEVRAYVPLNYVRFVRVGDKLNISSAQHQGSAAVSAVIPAADAQSQRAELRLKLAKDSRHWLAGELVSVKVASRDSKAAVTVHRDALILRSDGTYVVTVDANNIAHRKAVKVSEGSGDWVTVDEGLNAGEKVVTRGAERLQDGQAVSQS